MVRPETQAGAAAIVVICDRDLRAQAAAGQSAHKPCAEGGAVFRGCGAILVKTAVIEVEGGIGHLVQREAEPCAGCDGPVVHEIGVSGVAVICIRQACPQGPAKGRALTPIVGQADAFGAGRSILEDQDWGFANRSFDQRQPFAKVGLSQEGR
jgi:hypothetical protein